MPSDGRYPQLSDCERSVFPPDDPAMGAKPFVDLAKIETEASGAEVEMGDAALGRISRQGVPFVIRFTVRHWPKRTHISH